jgi:hypothetical protein
MSPNHTSRPPCRLHVVAAREADVAVVFRRGPSEWFHILRWDLDALVLESGAWLKGQLYPRRSNVSPDGQLLGYFALKGEWGTYFAVSKAPWATALAAWKTGGTWTTGCVFGPQRELIIYGAYLPEQPFHGRYPWPVETRGMVAWRYGRYFNEYTRGWSELKTDAQAERLQQLQNRDVQFEPHKDPPIILERRSESTKRTLGVCDTTDLMSSIDESQYEATYYLTSRKNELELLPDTRWADWDNHGRLLIATHSGQLQIHTVTRHQRELLWEQDLNDLTPQPLPAPEWAQAW